MTDIGTASISPPGIPDSKRIIAKQKCYPSRHQSLLATIVHSALLISALLGGSGLPPTALGEPANPPTASDNKQAAENTRQMAADSWITTQLKSRLLADEVSKNFPIGVETTAGAVVLKGSLPNQDSIDHVKYLAGSIAGVKSVGIGALKIMPR